MPEESVAEPPVDSVPTVGVLEARLSQDGELATLALAGELDLAGVDTARERLAEAVAAEPARVVIDLSELTFIDSTGISFLLSAVKQDDEGRLNFVACKASAVRRVFTITGVAELFGGNGEDSISI
jgi:anti-sigma B factor antagonist